MNILLTNIQSNPALWKHWEQLTLLPLLVIGVLLWLAMARKAWAVKEEDSPNLKLDDIVFYLTLFLMLFASLPFMSYLAFNLFLSEHSQLVYEHRLIDMVLRIMLIALGIYFMKKNKTEEHSPHVFRILLVSFVSFILLIPLIKISITINADFLINIGRDITMHPVIDKLSSAGDSPEDFKLIVVLVLSTCIVVPIYEEMVFRGFLQPALCNFFGLHWGIVFQCLFFAMIHPEHTYLPIFVFSLALSYTRHWSRSLIPCILMHMMLNAYTVRNIFLER